MIGHRSFEDFAVKGYDVIGKAVASLDRIVREHMFKNMLLWKICEESKPLS